jgi:hypothetical protein
MVDKEIKKETVEEDIKETITEDNIKSFVWLDKCNYRFKTLNLLPNTIYRVPEDISAKIALRAKEDFGDLVKLNYVDVKDVEKEEKEGMHLCQYEGCKFEADSTQGLSSHHAAHERKKDKKKKEFRFK